MSNGVAGGAAATSKGKSGGRMVGEEKQEKGRQEGDGEGRESDETCCWSIGLNLVPLPPRPPWTDADG